MFIYDLNKINDLEKNISLDRLSTYLRVTAGNKEKALKLYLWNSEISAAFYFPLQGLEVALRNALHSTLTQKYGSSEWYDTAPLTPFSREKVTTAKLEVQKAHGAVNAPHVVAELSFGFWTSLLNKGYHQTLWIPALSKAFPNSNKKRGDISDTFFHLKKLRNRIAHHEPVFARHLIADYTKVIETLRWIDITKSLWVDNHSSVNNVLARKP